MTLQNADNIFFKGGDDDNPIHFPLTNLGFINRTGPLYLSIDIRATNFEVRGEQWAVVKLNDNVINAFCSPDTSCENYWYACVSWMEVSDELSSAAGGSLSVEVSSTGVTSGPCDYLGYPLYARVFITELSPPDQNESLSIWAVIGPIIFGIGLIIFALWYCCSKRKSDDKYEEEPMQGGEEVTRLGENNPDPDTDPEANMLEFVAKPNVSPRKSPRVLTLRDAKVVPLENSVHELELVDHDHSEVGEGNVESPGGEEKVHDIESAEGPKDIAKKVVLHLNTYHLLHLHFLNLFELYM
jgi:hypothetical protein